MSSLSDLCRELHERLQKGEEWNDKFRAEVFTHPSLLEAAKRFAFRYKWIDDSIDIETAAWAVLSEGIASRAKPPREDFCVGSLMTMLKRWFLRLPGNWLRKDRKRLEAIFQDRGKREQHEGLTDLSFTKVNYYDQELLEGIVIGWIREFKEPIRTMAMLRFVNEWTYARIASQLKLAEATVYEHLQAVREKTELWRTAKWERNKLRALEG